MRESLGNMDNAKGLALITLITIILTGINGLIAYLFLIFLSRLKYGRDPIIKHGLASGTSRLGGVAIILSVIVGVAFNYYFVGATTDISIFNAIDSIIILSILIGFIGLVEDLSQRLSSSIRLFTMILAVILSLLIVPELVPYNLEIFYINSFFSFILFIFIFTVIMVCGFINAGNIADGANGLLSSIFLAFFVFIYSLDSNPFNFSMVMCLLAFIIYNVSTGRIFLGDFGAYSLSALVALKSLQVYQNHEISVFLLASLLIYPCFELIRSLLVRFVSKASLMGPDNLHLHNYINNYLILFGFGKQLTNSITGLVLGIMTSGPSLLLYFTKYNNVDNIWVYLFLVQITVLSIIYTYFSKKT